MRLRGFYFTKMRIRVYMSLELIDLLRVFEYKMLEDWKSLIRNVLNVKHVKSQL